MKAKVTASRPDSAPCRERGKSGRTGERSVESSLFRCDGDKDPGKIKGMFTAGGVNLPLDARHTHTALCDTFMTFENFQSDSKRHHLLLPATSFN